MIARALFSAVVVFAVFAVVLAVCACPAAEPPVREFTLLQANVGNTLLACEEGYRYHSGPAEKNPPLPTTENVLFTGVLDHVASTLLDGTCVTLGEAPETTRLDGAEGGNGCDHRALMCSLSMTVKFNELSNDYF